MLIRCEVSGSFYMEIEDSNPDVVEDYLSSYISDLENLAGDYININEYTWVEVK